MPSRLSLEKTIRRTRKQIAKQKNKQAHSKELHDKIAASDELERLRKKMVNLQDASNNIQRE